MLAIAIHTQVVAAAHAGIMVMIHNRAGDGSSKESDFEPNNMTHMSRITTFSQQLRHV
jgi:hypothetical protein